MKGGENVEILNLQMNTCPTQAMNTPNSPGSSVAFNEMLTAQVAINNNPLIGLLNSCDKCNLQDNALQIDDNYINQDEETESLELMETLQMMGLVVEKPVCEQEKQSELEPEYDLLAGNTAFVNMDSTNVNPEKSEIDILNFNNVVENKATMSMNIVQGNELVKNERIKVNSENNIESDAELNEVAKRVLNADNNLIKDNKNISSEYKEVLDNSIESKNQMQNLTKSKTQNQVTDVKENVIKATDSQEKEIDVSDNNKSTIGKETFQLIKQEETKEISSYNKESIEKVNVSKLPEELPKIIKTKMEYIHRGKDNKDQMVLQLEPKELGKITVKLSSEEGVVSVKILAEHSEAKFMLENGMSNLKESFQEQGIKYGRVDVEVGGQSLDQGQQQSDQNQWNNQNSKNYYEKGFELELDGFTEKAYDEEHMLSAVDYKV